MHRNRRIPDEINDLQRDTQRDGDGIVRRALHAKMFDGLTTARCHVADDLPLDLCSTVFRPGREFEAWAWFSNSANAMAADDRKGAFGMAVRVFYDPSNRISWRPTAPPRMLAMQPKPAGVVHRSHWARTR